MWFFVFEIYGFCFEIDNFQGKKEGSDCSQILVVKFRPAIRPEFRTKEEKISMHPCN